MDDRNGPRNFHKCKSCSFRTRFLCVILRHVRQHRTRPKSHRFICHLDSPQKYQCKKCQFQSHLKVLLTKHFKTLHNRDETLSYLIRPVLKCASCDFRTYSSLVLLNHDCSDKAGNTSVQKRSNSKRRRSNKLKKIEHYKCDDCPYEARQKGSLQSHVLRKHTPLKKINWFNCDECWYRVKVKHDLHRHILTKHIKNE